MFKTEGILLWISMSGYFITTIAYLLYAVFRKQGAGVWAWRIFLAGFAFQSLSIAARWQMSGRIPVMVSFEHYQIGAWFIAVASGILGLMYRKSRILLMFTVPVILFMLGVGMGTYSEAIPLSPPFKSNWLFIHIGFSWFAWGCFVVATAIAIVYLLKRPGREGSRFLGLFPERGVLDELMVRLIIFGFVCQGLMIVAGAIWARQLWGRYWGWDPIETWSLICWLVYGVVLHLRLMLNWRGTRMAVIVILALLSAIIYFWGIGFGPAAHTTLMLTE